MLSLCVPAKAYFTVSAIKLITNGEEQQSGRLSTGRVSVCGTPTVDSSHYWNSLCSYLSYSNSPTHDLLLKSGMINWIVVAAGWKCEVDFPRLYKWPPYRQKPTAALPLNILFKCMDCSRQDCSRVKSSFAERRRSCSSADANGSRWIISSPPSQLFPASNTCGSTLQNETMCPDLKEEDACLSIFIFSAAKRWILKWNGS